MIPTEPQPRLSTERFSVSESGMRELNIGREPWDLVKELIQNAWDEAPFSSECRVKVEPQPDGKATMIIVEDNGPGFSDIADSYTLMSHTSKRLHPTKRGRFNMGEKEVISVAIEAEVETVGQTVTFPAKGSRKTISNSRTKGTVVRVLMPWNEKESSELIEMLRRFIPPVNCHLFVNGIEVPHRPAVAIRSVSLNTIIQDAPNSPMRSRQRRTQIHFFEPTDSSSERFICEMGIPVQVINCPWDIDVMQKIPMAQQRNTISDAYLSRIYAETLNQFHKTVQRDELNSEWVKRAIDHPQIKPDAVKSTVTRRYGAKAVFNTLDQDANLRAAEAGYELVNPNSLSDKERALFREHAGVRNSDEVFPTPPPPRSDYEAEPGSNQARFAAWVMEMALHCNLDATVRYFNEPENPREADCPSSTMTPTLRFNAARLGSSFFQPPYESVCHWDLLLHELGHALTDPFRQSGHGEAWGEGVSKAGAFIAVHMIRCRA